MATMNISLPDPMRVFVENELVEGGYQTASEYFRDLVRERQRQKAQKNFEALIAESENSGPFIEATPAFWEALEHRLLGEDAP